MKPIAAGRSIPIRIEYSPAASRSCRPAERIVVLRASVDVVKREIVIHYNIVKLGDRQIRFEIPIGTSIKAFINATVAAYKYVIGVVRVDPNSMVIDMLETLAEASLSSAGVI